MGDQDTQNENPGGRQVGAGGRETPLFHVLTAALLDGFLEVLARPNDRRPSCRGVARPIVEGVERAIVTVLAPSFGLLVDRWLEQARGCDARGERYGAEERFFAEALRRCAADLVRELGALGIPDVSDAACGEAPTLCPTCASPELGEDKCVSCGDSPLGAFCPDGCRSDEVPC